MKRIIQCAAFSLAFVLAAYSQDNAFEANEVADRKEQIPIPEKYLAKPPVAKPTINIHYESRSKDGVVCVMVNQLAKSVRFAGYSIAAPWYRIQILKDGQWIEHRVGWFCGTGLYKPELISNRACRFLVQDPPDTKLPIRVGIDFEEQLDPNSSEKPVERTVWSEPITIK